MRLGKLQREALEFASKLGGWHTYTTDRTTKRVILSLAAKGLIEVNGCNQFRPMGCN
jgi:hypothetical protein